MSNDYPNLSTASQQLSQSTAALLSNSDISSADLAKFNTAVTQSKDALKALEPVPADSASKANAAMNAADTTWQGAKLRAALIKAATPYPDFWLPLVDSLDLEEGFGSVSFSRSTTATYIDKNGVLRTANTNEPRFEREGILIEGTSTNRWTWSQEASKWNRRMYCKFGDKIKAPDGSMTADHWVGSTRYPDELEGHLGGQTITVSAGEVVTFSIFIKSFGGHHDLIRITETKGKRFFFYTDTLEIKENTMDDASIRKLTDGWIRITTTSKITEAGHYYYYFWQDRPLVKGTLGVWGGQCEKLPFASSYIPTEDQLVTRAGDTLDIPTDSNLSHDEFTIDLTITSLGFVGTVDRAFYAGTHLRGDSQRWGVDVLGSSNTLNLSEPFSSGRYTVSSSSSLKGKIYQQGILKGSRVWNGKPTITPTLRVGNDTNGVVPLFGNYRNLRIWNTNLTDDQIALL